MLILSEIVIDSVIVILSEIVHVLKAVAILTSKHLNLSTIFVVSHFLIAKVYPEWRLNPRFGSQKKCPFHRGNKYKDYVNVFPAPNSVFLEWRCPLHKSVPKERFQCSQIIFRGCRLKMLCREIR